MNITVLTPTYNRAYILEKLYNSLVNQTNKKFVWLIIDDGSSDNTEEIISRWIKESKIKIKYFYQKNGGKHRALNNGIKKIKSDMTFIVDSDDILTEDAIETIYKYYEKYKNSDDICGFSFLRGFPNNEVNGKKFKKDEYKASYIKCRLNEKISGDKAEVYFTNILKQYPFLEIDNERFLFEDYVWIQIAEKYSMIHINKIIYIGNYLGDGLTKNMTKVKLNSPIGMSHRGLVLCSKKCNILTRFKGMIHYIAYGIYGKRKKTFKKTKYKALYLLSFPFGILYYLKLNGGKM